MGTMFLILGMDIAILPHLSPSRTRLNDSLSTLFAKGGEASRVAMYRGRSREWYP